MHGAYCCQHPHCVTLSPAAPTQCLYVMAYSTGVRNSNSQKSSGNISVKSQKMFMSGVDCVIPDHWCIVTWPRYETLSLLGIWNAHYTPDDALGSVLTEHCAASGGSPGPDTGLSLADTVMDPVYTWDKGENDELEKCFGGKYSWIPGSEHTDGDQSI